MFDSPPSQLQALLESTPQVLDVWASTNLFSSVPPVLQSWGSAETEAAKLGQGDTCQETNYKKKKNAFYHTEYIILNHNLLDLIF